MNAAAKEMPVLERDYGGYHARVCFAPQDVPDAEKNLLELIMETYRQRVERDME